MIVYVSEATRDDTDKSCSLLYMAYTCALNLKVVFTLTLARILMAQSTEAMPSVLARLLLLY